MLIKLKHLEEADETYVEHLIAALKISGLLFQMAASCFVHALFPWWCEKGASGKLEQLVLLIHRK